MNAPIAMVVGAGGVLGEALCAEFLDAGYRVAGLRRSTSGERAAHIVSCDLENPLSVWRVAHEVVVREGPVDVVICNAAHLKIAPFNELAFEDLDTSWRAGVGTAFGALRAVLPAMLDRKSGSVIITGATGSMRGSAKFSAFAASKFALRGLAQSLAREHQADGIHVAHVIIDGLLRGSQSAARAGARPEQCIDPRVVATQYRSLAEQPANAWTHEIDLRPNVGRF